LPRAFGRAAGQASPTEGVGVATVAANDTEDLGDGEVRGAVDGLQRIGAATFASSTDGDHHGRPAAFDRHFASAAVGGGGES
jgi:hypothetical protein